MKESEILQHLADTGALLTGHFQLRSGLHSDRYFQAAQVLQQTVIAAKLCAAMADAWRDAGVETVISPAIGGIIVGQEIGRSLGVKAIFAEKDEQSNLLLRRGFSLRAGERVLVAEDVITKGGRVQQTIDLVRQFGAVPVGVATMVDRSDGSVDFGIPMKSLIRLTLATYEPTACPMCQQGLPIDKPGSK